jgi:hypothetical protein
MIALAGVSLATATAQEVSGPSPSPEASLTLIPPSPVSDQIILDIRGAVWNQSGAARKYDAAIYLDEENPEHLMYRESLEAASNSAVGLKFRWPTKGKTGRHRVLLVARSGTQALRVERPIEILVSAMRSTRRLGGAWVDIYHHDEREGGAFNEELGKMTAQQWRELVRAMHETDQNIMVISMMFQNAVTRGRHNIETEGYKGKAYYPSKLYPGRMPIASKDPLETILSEADKLGMQVMPGVGSYAFRDYTPAALRWSKQVADELWERYGQHPSFYGWYVTAEGDGGLGNAQERAEMVEFFREFTPYVRRLAPDKPVMVAPNAWNLRGAEATYRKLLPNLDILCPFGYQRMPQGDLRAEAAAALMQSLCDETGCHLWVDIESFVFRDGKDMNELLPRPIEGLVSDFTRLTNFEKTLHYQFPGLMSSPGMSRQPGGAASVKLYLDYQRYLVESNHWSGPDGSLGKPAISPSPR